MRKNIWSCLTLIVMGLVMFDSSAVWGDDKNQTDNKPMFTEKPLYVGGLDEVNIYRIPSLITTQKGTLLEIRNRGQSPIIDLTMPKLLPIFGLLCRESHE